MLHLWTSVSSSTTDRFCVTASGSRFSVIVFLAFSRSFHQQFNCRPISLTKICIIKWADISADAPCGTFRVAGPRQHAPIQSGTRRLVPRYIPSIRRGWPLSENHCNNIMEAYNRESGFQIRERNGPPIVEIEHFAFLRVIRRGWPLSANCCTTSQMVWGAWEHIMARVDPKFLRETDHPF